MKRAKAIEVDYDSVVTAKTTAEKSGRLILPTDREQWRTETARRDLKAKAFAMVAKTRYQATDLFIIQDQDGWDGLFAMDADTRTCVHFELQLDDNPNQGRDETD